MERQPTLGNRVRKGYCTVLVFVASGLLYGCDGNLNPWDPDEYDYTVPAETDDGWRTASLAEKGMDAGPLVRGMNRLANTSNHLIHSILVVKDSVLVFEAYFDGADVDLFDENMISNGTLHVVDKHFTREELHHTASVTKSVTSQIFGIAVDRGYIPGIDATMLSFFPDYARFRDFEKDHITVRHLLTMTAGLPFDESTYPITDSRNDAHRLFVADDPIGLELSKDVVDPPGSTWRYSSGVTVLLGEIISRTTGQRVPSFAEERLFTPLGITSYRWAPCLGDPSVTHAAGGLYLRPRDMAKIGQLMLQDGMWDGQQVLSSEWVRQSVTKAIDVGAESDAYGYGFQWRLGRYSGVEAYYAFGWGDQVIVVLPEWNLVYVQTGGRYRGERVRVSHRTFIEEYVLPAIRDF